MRQAEFLRRCKELGMFNSPNIHQDFLPTCDGANNNIKETERYFFKVLKIQGGCELRIFKKSKRVSVSMTFTKIIDTVNKAVLYREWANEFLTLDRMAEYYGVTKNYLSKIIDAGRIEHNANCKNTKMINLYADEKPIDQLVEILGEILKGQNNKALVCCINREKTEGSGYLVGIATKGEKGYIPTQYVIKEPHYDTANHWVNSANKLIFDRPEIDTYKIVMSTMGY